MISKLLWISGLILLSQIQSCEQVTADARSNIEGKWQLEKVFLSDAYDTPCGWEVEKHNPLTLSIEVENDQYRVSGKSAVNSYFGTLDIISFDAETNIGKLEIGPHGSTKMAGPPELMNCETRFFDYLGNATDFRIEGNELQIGQFKKADSHPRDGGTFLVFEKVEED
ncbi:META domain-containing protein [Jiulongibacter sp. NS-SX5]|uniref:META domain-containing protein n=1 Tax=Jiulongibacter sp. NS-SX5 TaxID=3463854 RepID=UPI0040592EDA